jgi:hypothetical protein
LAVFPSEPAILNLRVEKEKAAIPGGFFSFEEENPMPPCTEQIGLPVTLTFSHHIARVTQLTRFQSTAPLTSANESIASVNESKMPARARQIGNTSEPQLACFHRAPGTLKKELLSKLNKTRHIGNHPYPHPSPKMKGKLP